MKSLSSLLTKLFNIKMLSLVPPLLIIFSWITSYFEFLFFLEEPLKFFRLLVFLFVPGYYLAMFFGQCAELRLEEILILDIITSMGIGMLVSMYMSFLSQHNMKMLIMVGLFMFSIVSSITLSNKLFKSIIKPQKRMILDIIKPISILFISFLIGFFIVFSVIPNVYWRGWDPWVNAHVAKTILEEGLNPIELGQKYAGVINVGISGFYYFLTAFQAFTGIDLYLINRFWGPVLSGIVGMITYLVVRRYEGIVTGLFASFILFINPFFITRFSMALRENLGFLFMLGILFILIVKDRWINRDWASRFYYSFILGLFLASSLSTHPLVAVIVYGIIFFELILNILNRCNPIELILALPFSLLMAAPNLMNITGIYIWTIRKWFALSSDLFFTFFIIAAILGFFMFYFCSRKKIFEFLEKFIKKSFFMVIVALFVGAVYSIIFPRDFPVLGSYNPSITLNTFALSCLFLACIGFLTIFRSFIPGGIISLSLLLIIVPNLTNVNIAFPLFRLVIYMSWVFSYWAAKSLRLIYDIFMKSIRNFSLNFLFLNKTFKIDKFKTSVLFFIMLLTLISPIMIQDLQDISKHYSYYNKEDVVSATSFINLLEDSDIVLPQAWTHDLLIYAGIDLNTMIFGRTFIYELYSVNSIQDLSQIIVSRYPDATRVHVFMIKRWIGKNAYPAPSPELLELWGEKHQLGNIVFYTVPLSLKIEELLEPSICVTLGARH